MRATCGIISTGGVWGGWQSPQEKRTRGSFRAPQIFCPSPVLEAPLSYVMLWVVPEGTRPHTTWTHLLAWRLLVGRRTHVESDALRLHHCGREHGAALTSLLALWRAEILDAACGAACTGTFRAA